MRNILRNSLWACALSAVVGCSAVAQRQDPRPNQGEASPRPVPRAAATLPERKLTPELLYELLVAEIAGQRGALELSAKNYLRAAEATRDPRLAKHGTRVAIYARDFSMAQKGARLWAQLAPDDVEAYQSLAALLIRAGDADAAVPHLEKVLSLSGPDTGHGFMIVTNLLSREPDKDRALKVMDRLAAQYPDDPNGGYAYAHLAFLVGRYEQSLERLDGLLKRKPQWTKALVLKVNDLRKLGREQEAVQTFQKAVDSDPENSELRLTYARLLVDERRLPEARQQFKIVARQEPDNSDVTYALGLLALQAGDLDEAERYLKRLIRAGQRAGEAAYGLGQIAEARGRDKEALDWYNKVDEGQNYLDARLSIGRIMAQQKGIEAARRYFKELREAETQPDDQVRIYLAEGDMLFRAQRYADAKALYDQALSRYPESDELLYARAMVFERLDRIDLLEADLRSILERDPDHVQALNALGYTLADRTGRYQEALELIQRALDLRPDDPAIIDSMGWVLYRLGRTGEAIDYLRRAARLSNDVEIAAHLGEVLWTSGQREEAGRIWDEALKRDPDDPILKQTIQRLRP